MVPYDLICSILYISNKYEELLQMHITNVCLPLTTSLLYRPIFRISSCFPILFSSQVEDKIETKKSVKAILHWGFLTIRSTINHICPLGEKRTLSNKRNSPPHRLRFSCQSIRGFSIDGRNRIHLNQF